MAEDSGDTMMGRLDACCTELLHDIDTKHLELKKSYSKPASDDARGGRSNKKSELRKSLSNISNTTKSLNLLSGYIESLETLRSKYVKYFIESLRNEIEILWEKCCYGEEQRSSCTPYFCDVFTEETLQEHEQELRLLNTHYHSHKELYSLVGKREKLWQEKVAFENPADGCSRFENRGGTLIKELKRYQVVEKQLPVTEKQIRTKVKMWEKTNRTMFLVQDVPYIKYLENQKLEYKQQQERKREAKRIAKQEELLAELEVRSTTATKRTSVYDKEANEETLRELMKPTESSLLKARHLTTPGVSGFAPLSSISETVKRNGGHDQPKADDELPSKLAKLEVSSCKSSLKLPKSHSTSKLTKLDTSSCKGLNSSKVSRQLTSSKSEGRLTMTSEHINELARPTASSMMKSRLPKKNVTLNTSTTVKKKVTLQTDPLKKKQQRRSLGARRRSMTRKENIPLTESEVEGDF